MDENTDAQIDSRLCQQDIVGERWLMEAAKTARAQGLLLCLSLSSLPCLPSSTPAHPPLPSSSSTDHFHLRILPEASFQGV